MNVDLVIKNARIVTDGHCIAGGLVVVNGKIALICDNLQDLPQAGRVIDAGGKYILPGGVDVHVHFRDPGKTYKEDFSTGSMAAAAGGITTIYDMPNVLPSTYNIKTFEMKQRIAEEKSFVNYGLYSFLISNLSEIQPLIDAGVGAFKWAHSLVQFPEEMPDGYHMPDNGEVLSIFEIVAKNNYIVSVHAEDIDIVNKMTAQLKDNKCNENDFLAHVEARPDWVELSALQRSVLLADMADFRLHIAHLTSKRGLEYIKQRKFAGSKVTCEVGPAWFLFNADDYQKYGGGIRVLPAIRYKEDAEALWQGLKNGDIDCLATDHAPHSFDEKFKRSWWDTLPGTIGVQTSMPLMLDKVNKGELTIERYVEFACEKPARIFGIYPRKGAILPGSDADLVMVDMDYEWTITHDQMLSKTKYTPYNGYHVRGKPVLTIVNGQIIMENGNIVGKPGYGKLVNPKKEW